MAGIHGYHRQASQPILSHERTHVSLDVEDTLGQKGEYLDVAENKSRIQKSECTGEVCSRGKVHSR